MKTSDEVLPGPIVSGVNALENVGWVWAWAADKPIAATRAVAAWM